MSTPTATTFKLSKADVEAEMGTNAKRYFGTARREILPYLPARTERILDIGCGIGATVEAIASERDVKWSGGVEIHGPSAAEARHRLTRVWEGAVEEAPFDREIEPSSLDLILCLDVLEHLVDPWTVVRRASPLLRPGGRLIVSLPNVRNWKFISKLLFRGDFRYRDAGLLDRTHLRFFVRETAIELATAGGLRFVSCNDANTYGPFELRRLLLALSFGGMTDLIAKQYIVVADQGR